MMNTKWPLARIWTERASSPNARPQSFLTPELSTLQACCMLGSGGLGKTVELESLARMESGVEVHRLVMLGSSVDALRIGLQRIAEAANTDDFIYLDSVDEVLIPVRQAHSIIANWIRESLSVTKPRLRVSCRPGVWSPMIREAMNDVYGTEESITVSLTSLSVDAVKVAAEAEGDRDRSPPYRVANALIAPSRVARC